MTEIKECTVPNIEATINATLSTNETISL